jgi:hypothetical protein
MFLNIQRSDTTNELKVAPLDRLISNTYFIEQKISKNAKMQKFG